MNNKFGSFYNIVMDEQAPAVPEVGMGATELFWSDRHAHTIIKVHGPKLIEVQRDKATRTDGNGISDAQSYQYEADPKGAVVMVSLRKNGKWIRVGESMRAPSFAIGTRIEFYDFGF
jgi:hypothetical protein